MLHIVAAEHDVDMGPGSIEEDGDVVDKDPDEAQLADAPVFVDELEDSREGDNLSEAETVVAKPLPSPSAPTDPVRTRKWHSGTVVIFNLAFQLDRHGQGQALTLRVHHCQKRITNECPSGKSGTASQTSGKVRPGWNHYINEHWQCIFGKQFLAWHNHDRASKLAFKPTVNCTVARSRNLGWRIPCIARHHCLKRRRDLCVASGSQRCAVAGGRLGDSVRSTVWMRGSTNYKQAILVGSHNGGTSFVSPRHSCWRRPKLQNVS